MLKKITIRSKLLIILALPLLGLIFYGSQVFQSDWQKLQKMTEIHEATALAVEMSALIHELQKERGMSAGYTGSKGKKFVSDLPSQQKLSSSKLRLLEDAKQAFEKVSGNTKVLTHLNKALGMLGQLESHRSNIMSLNFTIPQAVGLYSKSIRSLLDAVGEVVLIANNTPYSNMISGYQFLLEGKERAGIERAVLNGTFASKKMHPARNRKFQKLVAEQNAFFALFIKRATPEQVSVYNNALSIDAVTQTLKLRAGAFKNTEYRDLVNQVRGLAGYVGMIHDFKNYVLRGKSKYADRIRSNHQKMSQLLEKHRNSANSESLQALNVVQNTIDEYRNALDVAILQKKRGRSIAQIDARIKINDTPMFQALKRLELVGLESDAVQWFRLSTLRINALKEAEDVVSNDLIQGTENAALTVQKALIFEIITSIIMLLVTLVLATLLIRGITQDTASLAWKIRRASQEGNLEGDLEVRTEDEIGGASREFNSFVEYLRNFIGNVHQQTSEMTTVSSGLEKGSKQMDDSAVLIGKNVNGIATAAQNMAKSVTVMADSTMETTNTMEHSGESMEHLQEQIGSIVQSTHTASSSMQEVLGGMQNIATEIETVNNVVQDMSTSLSKVNTHIQTAKKLSDEAHSATNASKETIDSLSTASNEIGKIVKLIDSIAAQTNMLALNATIEAASAGEAGKGFAVVAAEVKELARQTSDANSEISQRIEEIRKFTRSSLEAVEKSSDIIAQVSEVNQKIAVSMKQQNEHAENVVHAVKIIEQTSESSSSLTETTNQEIQEISRTASQILEVSENTNREIKEAITGVQNVSELGNNLQQDVENVNQSIYAIQSSMISISDEIVDGHSQAISLAKISHSIKGSTDFFSVGDAGTPLLVSYGEQTTVEEFMPWSDQFKINVDAIDQQHRILVKFLNSLHRRVMSGTADSASVGKIMDSLIDYTGFHFEFEQELFGKHGYPETDAHIRIHKALVKKVISLGDRVKTSYTEALAMELMDFLKDWLLSHILKEDMKYARFLNDKGIY